jgi:hypothetical protein
VRHGHPHPERSPSFSALVIKSHVKDGVDLAVKYKLPRVVMDIIRQHHGTSLIQYFYHQAKQKEIQDTETSSQASGEIDRVSESTYRYDGPKPQFKESAIIFFADSMVRDSKLACARGWDDIAAEHHEYAGDDKFFDLLDETLQDRSKDATEQLAVFYTCLGLGFVGGLYGQPEAIRRKMHDCVARIGDQMDDASRGRICREAYEHTDKRPLNLPKTQRILVSVGILVTVLISVFVAAGFGYHFAQRGLDRSFQTIQTNVASESIGENNQ